MRGEGSKSIYDDVSQSYLQEKVITKLDIWSLCVGGGYEIKFRKFKPYAKALFLANYFDDTRLEFDFGNNESLRPDYKNGMRYGLNVGLGVAYNITSNFSLDAEASYSFMNIWNRRDANPDDYPYESAEEKMKTLNLIIGVDYLLF
jgi:opacity protein-like surface antigen